MGAESHKLPRGLVFPGKAFAKDVYTRFLKNLPTLPRCVHTHDLKAVVTILQLRWAGRVETDDRRLGDCASQNARKVN